MYSSFHFPDWAYHLKVSDIGLQMWAGQEEITAFIERYYGTLDFDWTVVSEV